MAWTNLRISYSDNPIIGYLYITTTQSKIISLKEAFAKAPLDVFFVDEAKLDDSLSFRTKETRNIDYKHFGYSNFNYGPLKEKFNFCFSRVFC